MKKNMMNKIEMFNPTLDGNISFGGFGFRFTPASTSAANGPLGGAFVNGLPKMGDDIMVDPRSFPWFSENDGNGLNGGGAGVAGGVGESSW